MLTSEMKHNLMHLAISVAEKEYGAKNVTGTAFMGVEPTAERPVASVTQYISSDREDYHVVFLLNMEKRTARVIDTHVTHDGARPWGTTFTCALCDKVSCEQEEVS